MLVQAIVAFLFVAFASANRGFPPEKFIKLTLSISKETYLPFDGKTYIQNGDEVMNCTIKKWTRVIYENEETEVFMFTDIEQKLVVFGFRGTETFSLRDWGMNFKILPKRVSVGSTIITFHSGFVERYAFIAPWFEREYKNVPSDYTIVITGHSLGAAEATVAAVYAGGKLKRKPDAVITYGSPFVGGKSLKTYFNKVVGCDRSLIVTAKGDPFTSLPALLGYTHVCDRTKIDGKTGMNGAKAHEIYFGYTNGLKRKYKNVNEINFGCDQILKK